MLPFFQVHETRIAQLEKERALKDELIRKKNTFNYILIGSIFLILAFLIFIIKDFISLSTELEQLKEYLDLEHMRFSDKFVYKIEVDESLDTDHIRIPNMLIQPQLENAIWHGLRYKESGGLLKLAIQPEGNGFCVRIEDNGIGIKKSNELKTRHQKEHHSRGLTNTRERVNLLNSLYHTHITIEITEKEGDSENTGVIFCLRFPLIV